MKTILIVLFVVLSCSVAGQGVQEDQDAGLDGNLEARCRLAWRYATGNGVPANPALVILWGEPAAKAGMAECMSLCGRAYAMQGNDSKALYWFKKGVEKGDGACKYYLARMYARGGKVKKDVARATALYREAAHEGIPGAACMYAGAYLEGANGVARDTNRALFWFRRALTRRDPRRTLSPGERDRARSIVTALEHAGYAERREAPGGCEDDDKQYVTIVYENGDRYNGEVEHGNVRQGWGAYAWASGGNYYEGEWKNGFRVGDGIYSSPRTGITYTGQSTDLFERVWGYTTSDSVTHYGTYQRSGEWQYSFSRLGMLIIRGDKEIAGCPGAVYYVGMFSNWKLRGRGRCYNKAGDLIYEGPFDEKPTETYPGVRVDTNIKFQRLEYADGVYEGETRHGKRSGFGVFHRDDGSVWIGTWESDTRLRGAFIDDRGRTKVEGYTNSN